MKKTRILISSLLILQISWLSSLCLGQKDIKNEVTKNILAFHIRYSLDSELGVNSGNIISLRYLNTLIPLGESEMELYIYKDSSLLYPVEGYILYRVENPGFKFNTQNGSIKLDNFHSFLSDKVYLLAYKETTNEIKYISGNMFLSKIAEDFQLSIETPKSFYRYLVLKYFNYGLKDVSFVRKSKDSYIFKAFSETINDKVLVTVSLFDFDKTKIKMISKKTIY